MTEPLARIRAALEEGAETASRTLGRLSAVPWRVEIIRHALCRLAGYPEEGLCSRAEVMAVVVAGVRAPQPGSVLVALEPKAALRLIRRDESDAWETGDAARAIDAYREHGGVVAAALAAALVPDSEIGASSLVEDSLPAAAVATHAPRDAFVVSAEIRFRHEGEALEGWVCLLVDAKLLPEFNPEDTLPGSTAG